MKEDNKGLVIFLSICLGILIISFIASIYFTYGNNQQWAEDYSNSNQGWCKQVNMHRDIINKRLESLKEYDSNGWQDLDYMNNLTCKDYVKW